MRRRSRVASLVAAASATLSVLLAPVPATAATGGASTTKLLVTRLPAEDSPLLTVLRLPPRTLSAGQTMSVYGRIAATTNVTRGPMMGARIICLGGGGGSPYTVRNHSGKAYGVQTVVVRWLFVAPKDGTFTCELRGQAATMLDPPATRLDLVADSTLLRMVPASSGSQQWLDRGDSCVGRVGIPDIQQCARPKAATTVMHRVIPTARAKNVTAVADVQLSREYGGYPGGPSTVKVTLEAMPANADNISCAPTKKTSATYTISGNLHHYKANLSLPQIPVNQSSACGTRVRIRTRVDHLDGNPVTVHNYRYSNTYALLY
ncbi:hypothetical protein [Actinopolymorpha alba]|uniref:hypothetical protein n=1 Tax=Actinopolymorpha alba TaxID=533267 RepID=UPI000380B237|nr:hypothetical protein [Actinopolymorpha alba]